MRGNLCGIVASEGDLLDHLWDEAPGDICNLCVPHQATNPPSPCYQIPAWTPA